MEPETSLVHEVAMLIAQVVALVIALTTLYKTMKVEAKQDELHQKVNGRMDGLLTETAARARLEGQKEGAAGPSGPVSSETTKEPGQRG